MSVEKKFLPTFHVFSPLDLSQHWFIYWYHKGKQYRRKGGINRLHSYNERLAAAESLIEQLKAEFLAFVPLDVRLREWIETRRGVWKPKTFRTENSRLEVFLNWAGKRKITNKLVKEFFVHLSKGRHRCTYHHYRRFMSQIFNGVGEGHLMEGVEKFSYTSTPAKYFQRHQIERIKKRLLETDPDLWLFCQFVYYTFIRPGELRFVKVSDILFDEWKICVRSTIAKNKKQQYVTVPSAFRPALEHLKQRSPNEFIFPSKQDITKPLGANTMLFRFRKILNELGFSTEYKLYSWKHTGAVACVRAGASLKELQIQLRHHSLEEVDKYIRQLGVHDLQDLEGRFPGI